MELNNMHPSNQNRETLVTNSPTLSNDFGHLVDLRFGTSKRSESLLRKLSCAFVLAVSEQFDDTTFVGGKAEIQSQ